MGFDAVIFDMDGVIVDSERYWHELERDLFADIIAEDVDPDTVLHEVKGTNYREIYDILAEEYTVTVSRDAFIDRFDETAKDLYGERVALMDGFRSLLDALHEAGVTVALASSSPHHWIDAVMDRFNLRDRFDDIVSADDVDGHSKPAPDIYEQTAAEIGVSPDRCLVIEDSGNGAKAAKAAGMTCIGYVTDENRDEGVPAADEIADGPAALRAVLADHLPGMPG